MSERKSFDQFVKEQGMVWRHSFMAWISERPEVKQELDTLILRGTPLGPLLTWLKKDHQCSFEQTALKRYSALVKATS